MIDTVLILSLLAFPVLVVMAAAKDLTSYTIPNWISVALTAAFVPAAAIGWIAGASLPELAMCVGVGAGALLAGVAMFSFGWIGGGDAKLFAASALWMGWSALAPFLLWTAVAGGVLSVALMIARKAAGANEADGWLPRLLTPGGPVPYGLAISTGALVAFAQSPLAQFAL